MDVRFHRLAAQEYRRVRAWYALRSRDIALRFVECVDAAVARIRTDPDAHALETSRTRWVRVQRFPYRLIYERPAPEEILVLTVAHFSRRGGYWRKRR